MLEHWQPQLVRGEAALRAPDWGTVREEEEAARQVRRSWGGKYGVWTNSRSCWRLFLF